MEDCVEVAEEALYDKVLLHHVEGHVGRLLLGPHQRRAEHDRNVRDVHPVVLMEPRDTATFTHTD